MEAATPDVRKCWAWLRMEGDCPEYGTLVATAKQCIDNWIMHTDEGMDVLASSELDNAIELLTAMRDLV